jgi:hypothetical protein
MADLDRAQLVELLGRLGASDDQTVLDAARAAHRAVAESGLSWNEVVGAETVGGEIDVAPAAEEPAGAASSETGGNLSDADKAEALRLIGRLLGGKEISDNLRQELTDMQRAIADGEFDAMDSRYIRALAKRLGA